jgi:hypothetical protein
MISPLTDEVRKSYADLPANWLKALWIIVQCIALARTTNLSVLKGYVSHVKGTKKARITKAESHYRYLTRFFDVVVYHSGFHLEDMSVEGPEKRELLFAILNLLFVICIREGEQFYRINPRSRQVKKDHEAGVVRVVLSTFRQGLAILLKVTPKVATTCRYLKRFWKRGHQLEWAFV